jgi:hypothetical protein
VYRLSAKFGYAMYLLQLIGIVSAVFEELTYSEIRYLLKFSSVRNIYNKLIQAEPAAAKLTNMQQVVSMAVQERSEAAFADELCYFPAPSRKPLTDEQRTSLNNWNDISRKEQSQLLLEILRRRGAQA